MSYIPKPLTAVWVWLNVPGCKNLEDTWSCQLCIPRVDAEGGQSTCSQPTIGSQVMRVETTALSLG